MALRHGLGITGNNQGVVTSMDHKLDQLGMVVKTGVGNQIRQGLFFNGTTVIVSGTPGTSTAERGYSVIPFTAVLSRGAGAGAVFITNDGAATPANNPDLRTTAADSSNPRIDTIYLWQREYILDGQDSEPRFGVVQGTPAANPQAPLDTALPAGAMRLADAFIPAGAASTNATGATVTQRGLFTAMAGGTFIVRNPDELPQSAVFGQRAQVITTGLVMEFINNEWRGTELTRNPATGVLAGATPPLGAPIIRYSQRIVVATNSNGDTNWVFPNPFPNGVISAHLDRQLTGTIGFSVHALAATQTLSQLNWRVGDLNGNPVAGATGIPYTVTVEGW